MLWHGGARPHAHALASVRFCSYLRARMSVCLRDALARRRTLVHTCAARNNMLAKPAQARLHNARRDTCTDARTRRYARSASECLRTILHLLCKAAVRTPAMRSNLVQDSTTRCAVLKWRRRPRNHLIRETRAETIHRFKTARGQHRALIAAHLRPRGSRSMR
eukprot:4492388-Alexandrium_andersonii.AAC.1